MSSPESTVSRMPIFARLGELGSQRYLFSLGAQALVSGFHFGLNFVLLQRMSLFDYGVFAFAFFTLAQFAGAVNNALISTPLTVYTPTITDEEERANKESMFSLLNILLFLVLVSTGVVYMWAAELASNLVLSVTLFVAIYAARQYSRSMGYARLRPLVTATGDTCYVLAGIVLTTLLVWRFEELTVEWVLLVLSGANLVAMIVERFRLDGRWWSPSFAFDQLVHYKEIWLQSRWALIGAMTTLFLAQAHSLIITWVKGPTAFAPLAAGFVLFGPVRVALITWQNMVKPELAVKLSENLNEAVAAQIKRTLIMMGFAVVLLAIGLMVMWPFVNEILYAEKYSDQPMRLIVFMWAAITFFAAIYNAPAAALQALKDFRVLAMSSVYGALISAVMVSCLALWLPKRSWRSIFYASFLIDLKRPPKPNATPTAVVDKPSSALNLMHTAIAICTYQRPSGLNRLLEAIAKLALPDGVGDENITVVVVDNHQGGEGLAVCEQLAPDYRFALRATCQPGNGISEARNAAVAMALSVNPTYVGFLDDDEWPEAVWLTELVTVLERAKADVVGGPTRSVFPSEAPPELLDNPYFGADMKLTDGAVCELQAAGNFLIRSTTLAKTAPVSFHPAFAHSGGEDLAFFTQLSQQGARMVWAQAAVVHEEVPSNRLSHEWLRTRVIGIANSRVRVMQMMQPGWAPSIVRGSKTLALAVQAGLYSAAGLASPKMAQEAEQLRWKFVGKFTAHFNRKTTRPEGH